MPSEDTPVHLNKSDFWILNCQRDSVRASNSFRVCSTKSRSVLFSDAELSSILQSLPLSRQVHPYRSLETFDLPTFSSTFGAKNVLPPIRTSRSVELEVMQSELNKMEDNMVIVNKIEKERDLVRMQRNQLMKINEGLAKYISTHH